MVELKLPLEGHGLEWTFQQDIHAEPSAKKKLEQKYLLAGVAIRFFPQWGNPSVQF